MLEEMRKMGMWMVSLHANREEEISREIEVFYKGKKLTGIQSLSMNLIQRKMDEGGNLLVADCKLKEVD